MKIISSFLFFIALVVLNSCITNHKVDLDSFKQSSRKVTLSHRDSIDVMKSLNGDFKSFYETRQRLRNQLVQNHSWERLGFELNMSIDEAKKVGEKLKLDTPFYISRFISDTVIVHPLKKKILSDIRSDFKKISNDDAISSYNNSELMDRYFQFRAVKRRKLQETVANKLRKQPTVGSIDSAFLINTAAFASKHWKITDWVVDLTTNNTKDTLLFKAFIEESKESYLKSCKNCRDVQKMGDMQYYMFRVNAYSFDRAGGFNL